jgi:hypothetical protein
MDTDVTEQYSNRRTEPQYKSSNAANKDMLFWRISHFWRMYLRKTKKTEIVLLFLFSSFSDILFDVIKSH